MSVEAAKWAWALGELGHHVLTVAGAGRADRVVPGLAWGAEEAPTAAEVEGALAPADLVVVENLCSLPLNPAAATIVARVLSGRRAVLRHHDLAWQRPGGAGAPPPPTDPAWVHVTINELSRRQLAAHGIPATTLRNSFDPCPVPGERESTRERLGVAPERLLVLQPTRAVARKRVPAALVLAGSLDAHYWLLGPAEEGYGERLEEVLAGAKVPVHRDASSVADAYAACDVVALPSGWEGFGNPAIESAVHRRPLAIGHYPVAEELAAFGFAWWAATPSGARALRGWLDAGDRSALERNRSLARRHFSLADLPRRLSHLLSVTVR